MAVILAGVNSSGLRLGRLGNVVSEVFEPKLSAGGVDIVAAGGAHGGHDAIVIQEFVEWDNQ